MQQVEQLLSMLACPIGVLVLAPTVQLLIWFPADSTGKPAQAGQSAWVPATHVGDQVGVVGSWFWPGPDLVAICGVSK